MNHAQKLERRKNGKKKISNKILEINKLELT